MSILVFTSKIFGHCLSAAGIHLNGSWLQAMLSAEASKTRELRRFNGMVAYLEKVSSVSLTGNRTTEVLLKEFTDWMLAPGQQRAFDELRGALHRLTHEH